MSGGAATVSAEIVAASVPIVKVPAGTQTCAIPDGGPCVPGPGSSPVRRTTARTSAVPADADEAGAVAVTVGAAVSDGVRDPVGDDPAGADVVEPPAQPARTTARKGATDGRRAVGRVDACR